MCVQKLERKGEESWTEKEREKKEVEGANLLTLPRSATIRHKKRTEREKEKGQQKQQQQQPANWVKLARSKLAEQEEGGEGGEGGRGVREGVSE